MFWIKIPRLTVFTAKKPSMSATDVYKRQCLNLPCPEPDLKDWTAMIDAWKHPEKDVTVALVGKLSLIHI